MIRSMLTDWAFMLSALATLVAFVTFCVTLYQHKIRKKNDLARLQVERLYRQQAFLSPQILSRSLASAWRDQLISPSHVSLSAVFYKDLPTMPIARPSFEFTGSNNIVPFPDSPRPAAVLTGQSLGDVRS
jgi:hypothetical protein